MFWYWSHVFVNFFYSFNKSFSSNRFYFIVCLDKIILELLFHWSIIKFAASFDPCFVWFLIIFIYVFFEQHDNYNTFQEIIHSCLIYISIAHNENLNPLLNLLKNCLLAKSAPHLFPITDEYTFRFSNFLIIGLCNSSANSLLDLMLFLIVPPEVFIKQFINHWSKTLYYPSYFGFLEILNDF